MQPLRESLQRLLEAHEPNPALIVDGLWNLIQSNRAASLLWDGVDPELLEPPINMLRLGVHPGGLPRISSMTAACNAPLIHRLKRRSHEDADSALAKLIREVEAYLPGEPPTSPATAGGLVQPAYPPWRGQAVHGHRHPRSPARCHGREPRDRDLPADGRRERSEARQAQRAPICLSKAYTRTDTSSNSGALRATSWHFGFGWFAEAHESAACSSARRWPASESSETRPATNRQASAATATSTVGRIAVR